jgi:hypothetical protein
MTPHTHSVISKTWSWLAEPKTVLSYPLVTCVKLRNMGHRGWNCPVLLSWPYGDAGLGTNLQGLSLVQTKFTLDWYLHIVALAQLQGVKSLIVQYAGDKPGYGYGRQLWHGYAMNSISDAIVTHLPNLERLEWSRHHHDRRTSLDPFGSLKGASKLIDLTLDFNLMTPADRHYYVQPSDILKPQEHPPPRLETLHVTCISKTHIDLMSEAYLKTTLTPVVLGYILGLVGSHSLTHIQLSFAMDPCDNKYDSGDSELPRRARNFFPTLITALSDIGITMVVWRQEDTEGKMLYKAGYEAAWPQLLDLSCRIWRRNEVAI